MWLQGNNYYSQTWSKTFLYYNRKTVSNSLIKTIVLTELLLDSLTTKHKFITYVFLKF